MDLGSFSDDSFEPVKWINESFNNNKSSDNEKFASNIIIKLQSFIQEINKSLEDFSKDIYVNLGKVNKEIILIKDEVLKSKSNLDQIQCEINYLQIENNAPFMQKLIEMNLIKNRMQTTCNSLREADNWINISKEIEHLFELGEIDSIAIKLITMQKSLELLTNIPDYVDRIVQLNSLKKKFEVLLTPKISLILNTSFQNNLYNLSYENEILITKYVQYFKDVDKLNSLKKIYHDSFCHKMVLEWQKIKDFDFKENIFQLLSNYIDFLIEMWNNQNKVVNLIVDNIISDFLIDLYIDLFIKLNDDITQFLLNYFDSKMIENNKTCIDLIIKIKTCIDRLVKNIEVSIENKKFNDKITKKLTELFILIYYPYKKLLQIYLNFEDKLLDLEFLNVTNTNSQLNEFVFKIFQNLSETEKRIYSLSNSVLMPKFTNSINKHFIKCLNFLNTFTIDLENQVNYKEKNLNIAPDWKLFQKSIYYLQIIGEFNLQFECFQQQIFNSLIDLRTNLSKTHRISQKFDLFFLDEIDLNNFDKFDLSDCNQLFKLNQTKLFQLCHKNSKLVLIIAMIYIEKYLDQIDDCFNKSTQSVEASYLEQNENKVDILKLSLTPNEYITQIGQYLLTLPQHIESFINQENIALKSAFKYLYLDQEEQLGMNLETNNLAEFFLNLLIHQSLQKYLKKIKQFNFQNNQDKFQLATDIEYIKEVIEDLGFTPNKYLNKILSDFIMK